MSGKQNPADARVSERERAELEAAGIIAAGVHPTYLEAILSIYEKLPGADKAVFFAYVRGKAGEAGVVMKAGNEDGAR